MPRMPVICLLILIVLIGPSRALPADITAEQVKSALDRGISYLKKQQKPDGSWPEMDSYPTGVTALCTLTLLNCGLPPDDPALRKALDFLRRNQPSSKDGPDKTYSVALHTMVFCAAFPKQDLAIIRRGAQWLKDAQIHGGDASGGWGYKKSESSGDRSNSQFALLALHEADLAGVQIESNVWELARKYWEESQNPDGSWGYGRNQTVGLGSMTCAGVTSLVISAGHLSKGDAEVEGDRVLCCGQQQKIDAIERGLDWLGRNFTVEGNPINAGVLSDMNGRKMWRLYYLYGLERVGRMTARRFIGTHDWYREGAEALVRDQDKADGFWQSPEAVAPDSQQNVSTCFALLFMSKGRRPVLLAKLKFGADDDWNHHRADVANLTTYVETKWQRPMAWQVFDLAKTNLDDLLQSPVLFLSGSRKLTFSEPQIRQLRDYIDRGGFIFADATCPNCTEFDKSFQALMKKMFPEPEYALRLLPLVHPIWHAEEPVPPDLQRPLWGVDFGCRTCVVYAPPPRGEDPVGNLACYWELWRSGRERQFTPKVQREIDAANSIGINVLAYATNRELKYKDQNPRTTVEAAVKNDTERGSFRVANVRHPGGCDVAPGALPNLLRAAANNMNLRVVVENRMVALTDDALSEYAMLFMHGRNGFRLTDEERKQLRKFVIDGDGLLLADAICANPAFAKSFRDEMKAIFPQYSLQPIPPTDTLLTDKHGGYDLSKVQRRELQTGPQQAALQARLREGPPELEGIKIGERYAVIFSPYDLSCALEKHQSLECEGYVRDDAERIGLNVVRYFLNEASASPGKAGRAARK